MKRRGSARAVCVCAAVAGLSVEQRSPAADAHRIAAVDPDAQLTRALDVALSPWGAGIVEVHLEAPGATMPIAVDRARDIARDTHADVIVWVSDAEGGYALWIYDAASDHTSSRRLESSPPFDAATAAAVALAVKTLLRGTVVAPPPERFGAVVRQPRWMLGASFGVGLHLGTPVLAEPRIGLHASAWPSAWGHRWGVAFEVESGPGAHPSTGSLAGTVTDSAVRVAVAARVPVSDVFALEASVGGGLHLVVMEGVVVSESSSVSAARVDVAVEPRLGVSFSTLGGRLVLAPWLGASMFPRWQRFLVHGAPAVEMGALAVEGALCAVLAFP